MEGTPRLIVAWIRTHWPLCAEQPNEWVGSALDPSPEMGRIALVTWSGDCTM